MIIRFNRYHGDRSDHETAEAESHKEAYRKYIQDLNQFSEKETEKFVRQHPLIGVGELRATDFEEESILIIQII